MFPAPHLPLRQQAFLFRYHDQRGDFPQVGNSQFFKSDNVVGVELLSHAGTARVEAVQLRQ